MLFFVHCFLIVKVECRPFYNSRFYADEHHLRGIGHAHYDNYFDSNHQDSELRFASYDQETKKVVENKIDLSKLNHNSGVGNFLLVPFLDESQSRVRRRFAILRHQNRVKYRKRVSHGITGLWG